MKDGEIDGWNIPSVQSGKFSDANVCYSEMDDDESSLHFMNCCPILRFYVDESIGVKSIKITSSVEEIAGDLKTIIVEAPEGYTLYDVMPGDEQDKRICYVAIDGREVLPSELTFESETTTQGTVTRTPTSNISLESGTMYNAFIPYYVEVDGQKWAYCNIGAFLPEDLGYCFSWGNTDGHWLNGNTGDGYVFDSGTYAGTKGSTIPSGNPIPQNSEYDAAYVNWGGNWRMPTFSELGNLTNGSSSLTTHSISGKYGYYCFEDKIFLPVAGPESGSNACSFWSSDADNKGNGASCVGKDPDGYISGEVDKYLGKTIRPIYEEPVLLSGEFTVNSDGKKVRFTNGNLYWKDDKWYVEKNQWDFRTTGSNGVGMFYYSTDATIARTQPYKDDNATINDKLFCDETRPLIIEGKGGYYCLSRDEWQYLVTGRTAQTNLCARARVNGLNGLLIFPDGYSQGTIVSGTGISNVNQDEGDFPTENIPSDIWNVMESNGVLFLAIYGYISTSGYFYGDTNGCFWSSTPSPGTATYGYKAIVNAVRATVSFTMTYERRYGYSIRLVKNIPQNLN